MVRRRQRQAPVAQLDRASVYGTEGREFESLRARRKKNPAPAGFLHLRIGSRTGAAGAGANGSANKRRRDRGRPAGDSDGVDSGAEVNGDDGLDRERDRRAARLVEELLFSAVGTSDGDRDGAIAEVPRGGARGARPAVAALGWADRGAAAPGARSRGQLQGGGRVGPTARPRIISCRRTRGNLATGPPTRSTRSSLVAAIRGRQERQLRGGRSFRYLQGEPYRSHRTAKRQKSLETASVGAALGADSQPCVEGRVRCHTASAAGGIRTRTVE